MIWFAACALFGLIFCGFHVAAVLGFLSVGLTELFSGAPLLRAAGQIGWTVSTDFLLVAVPMFILMGELLLQSGVAASMYRALDRWLSWLPGGLMHTNIASTALFAASSGSSVATAATIGTLSIPNIRRGRYKQSLFLGSLAAGGTLGILIPPSINIILYGVLAEASVPRLYLAALIPGVLLVLLFMALILVTCVLRPEWGGRQRFEWAPDMIAELAHLLPPVILFLVVVGSIYGGLATPTEAAALGVVGALFFALSRQALTRDSLVRAFVGTMRTTCMMMLIVLAAFVLNFVMVTIGLTDRITGLIVGLDWGALPTLLAIIVFYLLLGCVMDTVALMITTTPVVVPIVVALGYDPVWFGVVFILLIEVALITPPIGLNLFVIQGVRGEGSIADVIAGALPFIVMIFAMIGLLIAVPELALWLPDAVMALRYG